MNLIKQYNKYIIDFNSINNGMQIVFRFDNNYGLSVVSHSFSYGNKQEKFEIAIIKFNSEDDDDWNITYDTLITDDVLGYQSKGDTLDVIRKTMEL
ncbi:MAG: hypothetical protein ACOVJ5_01055 [Gloeomargaritales cyanobacterium]|jgi:hypothetical protein